MYGNMIIIMIASYIWEYNYYYYDSYIWEYNYYYYDSYIIGVASKCLLVCLCSKNNIIPILKDCSIRVFMHSYIVKELNPVTALLEYIDLMNVQKYLSNQNVTRILNSKHHNYSQNYFPMHRQFYSGSFRWVGFIRKETHVFLPCLSLCSLQDKATCTL